jgi:transcriptional regulator with XRE-family HTH domain
VAGSLVEEDMTLGAQTFAQVLKNAMTHNDLSQEDLARKLKTSQSAVSEWLRGRKPGAHYVYEMEAIFELPNGSLARLLGYLPPEDGGDLAEPRTVEAAVLLDPRLNDDQKQQALSLIRTFVRLNQALSRLEGSGLEASPPAPEQGLSMPPSRRGGRTRPTA